MVSPARRLRLVLALAAALCLAAPVGASAATTRYASPTGTGASPCAQSDPCSIEDALSFAKGLASFDTVLLAPGTYHPAGELQVEGAFVTVEGESGRPAPLIEAAGERGLFFQNTGTIRDVRIHSTMATTYGLALIGPESVIERVESTGEAFRGCSIGAVVMRDSVCSATPSLGGGEGIEMFTSGTTPSLTEADLFNVTAIGGRVGIIVGANQQSSVTLNATNTISSGGTADIAAESHAATAPVAVNLSHSNFKEIELEGAEASISLPNENANQEAPPVFVDAAAGDYREQATSPTRLAGDLSVLLPGETDLAGNPRTTNCEGTVGVDIGAYQYECPVVPPSIVPPKGERKPDPPVCACVGSGSGLLHLKHLAMKPAKFVVEGKAPKGVARGTTVSFTLNIAASVRLEVLGKPTVKGKKPKTVVLGTFTEAGKAGANHFKFSGRLKGKALAPGAFTLRATAVAAGRRSDPQTERFTVLAPVIP